MRQIFLCGAMVLALAGCSKGPTAAPIGVMSDTRTPRTLGSERIFMP